MLEAQRVGKICWKLVSCCFLGYYLSDITLTRIVDFCTFFTVSPEKPVYLHLLVPAVDWILQCVAHNSSQELMVGVMNQCEAAGNSALLLNSVMSAFPSEYIAAR